MTTVLNRKRKRQVAEISIVVRWLPGRGIEGRKVQPTVIESERKVTRPKIPVVVVN